MLFGDEGDEQNDAVNTRTIIIDVSALDNPTVVGEHLGGLHAIDHNQYVRDGFSYQANYTIGLSVMDLADVANGNLTEVAFFDTYPNSDGKSFNGAWSVYPFFDSCSVVISDIQRGLFVLRPSTRCVCGNAVQEGSEECDGTEFGGATCDDFGCSGGILSCDASCSVDLTFCTDCGPCDFDASCDPGEDCISCPNDCIAGTASGVECGNGVCEAGDGEDCLSCAADCSGKQNGRPSGRFCCGDGDGQNPIQCTTNDETQCNSGGFSCTNIPVQPGSYYCGDSACEGDETSSNCEVDCEPPPPCLSRNDACSQNSECCSGKCKGNGKCR